MKKLLIFLLLAISVNAMGQKLVIGSSAPAIKDVEWKSGSYDPKAGNVILFYQASNASCKDQYEVLKSIVNAGKANGIVITRDADVDGNALSYGGKISVAYDPTGSVFNAYGIKYLPYAVAVGKDGKISWLGSLKQ